MNGMPDGVLLIDKPASVTSHDVVGAVRKLYGTKQVGHTGTLDPMATGLLTVLVGRAVKASEYATAADKTYRAGLKLGITTDTEDTTGNVLTISSFLPTPDEVERVCGTFVGKGEQVPPMYSALKVGGRKLVDLAREGITVERQPRPIEVFSLRVEPADPAEGEYILDAHVSKGTYIRTLCADIGAVLGCGGVMSSLRRAGCGGKTVESAVTLESLKEMTEEERLSLLSPVETLFEDCPILNLPPFFARLAECGNEIYLHKLGAVYPEGTRLRLYDGEGFFSLAEVRAYPDGQAAKPIKKFRL